MKTRQTIVVLVLCVLVGAGIAGFVLTRDSGSGAVRAKSLRPQLVDEQPIQTARRMAALASTREEQRFAQQAVRLADHAVDLAFAGAMREATLHQGGSTPEEKELFARVGRAEAQVKLDQDMIDSLKKETPKATAASGQEIQKQLDMVQAQMELDKDDLDNAQADLLRSGADPLSRIQRQFARYQAQQQNEAARAQSAMPSAEAPAPPSHFIGQFSAWRQERAIALELQQAREEALRKREELQRQHASLKEGDPAQAASGQPQRHAASTGESADQVVIATLRQFAERHKNLSDLEKRMQDHQDLADIYANWIGVVQARQRASIHGMIRSGLLILLIVLCVYLAGLAVDRFFEDVTPDVRRRRTLQVIVRFAAQAIGLLLTVLVLVGIPNDLATVLGLAGAGLTVALKDFIVAFVGWFALMGRNGIRVGDWVEIEGVVGEVAQITLLRTVLLETGNWTEAGHLTGRKVGFVNSFAIEGH
jgi:hypothetical protein